MLTQFERYWLKAGIAHIIIGTVPQLILAWSFINNYEYMVRMIFNPFVMGLLWLIPGFFIYRLGYTLVGNDLDRKKRQDYIEAAIDRLPFIFVIPLFQFQAGIIIVTKLTMIYIIRLIGFRKAWVTDI